MSGKKRPATKTAAVVTIHRPADMSAAGRKDIAKWLRSCARLVEKYGDRLSVRVTCRYVYEDTQ